MPAHHRPRGQAVASGLLVLGLLGIGACSSAPDDGATGAPSPSADPTQSVVDSLVTQGLEQVGDDRAAAKKSFEAVLAIQPDNVYANYNLGYLAQTSGDDGSAIGFYTDAINADTEFTPALYNLAILTEASDLDGAVELYRRVLQTEPDDPGTLFRLGRALVRTGHRAEGKQLVARAVELDPSLAE